MNARHMAYAIVANLIDAELRGHSERSAVNRELERILSAMRAAAAVTAEHPAGCLCRDCREARSAP